MCLAIYKPVGEYIPENYLENGFEMNSDGAGFAYRNGDNIVIEKGFFRFESFIKAWRRVSAKQALIHFRWATSGKKDIDNCHPFIFNKGKYVMIHNGVLSHRTEPEKSDTVCFVQDVLEPMSKTYGFNPKTKSILEKHIGRGNKIAVMSKTGKVHFLNEDAGHWLDKVWYSNDSYTDSYTKWCSASYTYDDTPLFWRVDDTDTTNSQEKWWESHWRDELITCDFCGDHYDHKDVTKYKDFKICCGCENQFEYESKNPPRETKLLTLDENPRHGVNFIPVEYERKNLLT